MSYKRRERESPEYDPNDRITFSIGKGYRTLLHRIAKERNTDLTKLVREALDKHIRSFETKLDPKSKERLEWLRRLHGGLM